MKRCSSCMEVKPDDEFYPLKRAPDGLSYRCKSCDKAYHVARYDRVRSAKPIFCYICFKPHDVSDYVPIYGINHNVCTSCRRFIKGARSDDVAVPSKDNDIVRIISANTNSAMPGPNGECPRCGRVPPEKRPGYFVIDGVSMCSLCHDEVKGK